ncbi:GroES-like protein, partial [Gloeophyllum trabeum ATCC 11539]
IPEPAPDQVQVKIHATAVNPVDYKIFDYGMFVTVLPTVLGTDAAGEVTKVGGNVSNFRIGDRILFQGQYNCQGDYSNGDKATFQQFCLTDADLASKIPPSLDYDSASTIPVGIVTAAAGLYDLSLGLTSPWKPGGEGKYRGQVMVVLGGSSSVGSYTIQLAALSGFKVITTASASHETYLKSIGASTVIDRKSSTLVDDVLEAAGGEVRYLMDAIALPNTQKNAVDIVSPGGSVILTLPAEQSIMISAMKKRVRLRGCHGASHMYPDSIGFWAAMEGYLERGVIKPNRPHVLPGGLASWKEAFELHRSGKVSGEKIVLRPQET